MIAARALPLPPPLKPLKPLTPLPVGLLYYPGVRCPSCGGRHFAVGRVTAECAACEAALVLSNEKDPTDGL